jgi:hypothetical protein
METSTSKTKNAIGKAISAPNLLARENSIIYSYNKTKKLTLIEETNYFLIETID